MKQRGACDHCGEPGTLVVRRWGRITAIRCKDHEWDLMREATLNRDGSYQILQGLRGS